MTASTINLNIGDPVRVTFICMYILQSNLKYVVRRNLMRSIRFDFEA